MATAASTATTTAAATTAGTTTMATAASTATTTAAATTAGTTTMATAASTATTTAAATTAGTTTMATAASTATATATASDDVCYPTYIVAGSVSVAASKALEDCFYVTSMTMNIIACVFSGIHIGVSAGSADNMDDYDWNRVISKDAAIFLDVLALLLSLAEFIAAFATSIYDCKASCTPYSRRVTTLHSMQTATVPDVIYGPNSTHGQPIIINPRMIMHQQQPGPSTAVQAETLPAYQSMVASQSQTTKQQL
ncbi:hypothetical protein CAPTEDRAFT_222029 [Capitella teleta]|uniref:MARVEL domain-containing protein n=1 Tax=Capitella teleta TaxID=283909 RepID=R7U2D9_CAPTE|nr:hypothetical protein CAPTEDRAFT_222029 [Capitella teleta]|eukprot:ELU00058.1 hypothetical protein CAPTEDRAFT_222029 [Capitella teleta]